VFEGGSDAFRIAQETGTTSLAELMSAFTHALDLTEGQPEGHSIRCCYIATRIGQVLSLDEGERQTIYYATMLKDLGCSSNAARIAELYLTDDRRFKHDYKLVGSGLGPVLEFVLTRTGAGQPLRRRARAIANILRNGPDIARSLIETRCTRGADIARRLRFPEPVAAGIAALDEHWDGSGKPLGTAGTAIPLAARIALLAQIADVFFANAGPDAARAEIGRQRGRWFDPALCDAFAALAATPDFWAELAAPDIAARVLALDPADAPIAVDEDFLDDIALAFGQVIDAKSPYTAGHSERVGHYCDAVARELGISPADRRSLRRAAILHDVGKLAVSSAVLEKPGKLDADEWQVMQSHAAHTTAILGRIAPFRSMAAIAGSHHERLDGTGYPLGLTANVICREARIISVGDFYDALTADRPYRAAMAPDRAMSIMAAEVGKAIDPDCFAALQAVIAAGLDPAPLPVTPAHLLAPGGPAST